MYRARYRRIVFFFARVITHLLFWELLLSHTGFRKWSKRTRPQRLKRIAREYRALAIQMGGVLIKVGQFLSARVDMLPTEITDELAELQDEVPPEAFEDIRRVAEEELGAPLSARFVDFTEEPIAAASLGQVHRAKLYPQDAYPTSENEHEVEVVVKVQRPNIETIIATDLAAIRTIGKWLNRYPPFRKRADILALLNEFTRVLFEEIDYLAEGKNAETFAVNFKDRPHVRVPVVVWTHTTKRVLTLEDVYAIKITDFNAITAAGIDRAEVAKRLINTYLQQIFEDYFFHADPHPGNLFVSPILADGGGQDKPTEWQLTFVDFGMIGHVPSSMRAGLRELVIAMGMQDATRLVNAYQMLGVLLPHADLKLLEQAEAMAFDRFWGKSMAELKNISMREIHEFALEFRQIVYSMPFQIPQDLIWLGRAVAILSGMCMALHPQFNPWESIIPFAQKLIEEEALTGWEFWLQEIGQYLKTLFLIPKQLERVLGKLDQGSLDIRIPDVEQRIRHLEAATRRMVGAFIFAALLIGGLQLYLSGNPVLGEILLAGAAFALAWVVLSR
ncbi:MAG: AarF/UbiB family protein [Chloroflexota bacterium]